MMKSSKNTPRLCRPDYSQYVKDTNYSANLYVSEGKKCPLKGLELLCSTSTMVHVPSLPAPIRRWCLHRFSASAPSHGYLSQHRQAFDPRPASPFPAEHSTKFGESLRDTAMNLVLSPVVPAAAAGSIAVCQIRSSAEQPRFLAITAMNPRRPGNSIKICTGYKYQADSERISGGLNTWKTSNRFMKKCRLESRYFQVQIVR